MSQDRAIEELGKAKSATFSARANYRLVGQPITDKRLLAKFDKLCGEIEHFQHELARLQSKQQAAESKEQAA